MPEGFRIARGYVEVVAEIEREQVRETAGEVGDEAGKSMGDGLTKGAGDTVRKNRKKFGDAGDDAGKPFGMRMGSSAGQALGQIMRGNLGAVFSNPYILGAAVTAGAALAPALGAGIAAGLIGGAGLGAIAGGIALIADRPEVKKAAGSLKDRFLDMDTTELEANVLAAQERLAAARKSKNKDAIKEAKADLRTLQTDLDKAQAYNAKNFSLKDAAGPLIQPVIEALGIFQQAAGRIIPKIGQMFAKLDSSGAIPALATGIVSLVENALPGMLKLVEVSGPFLVSVGPALGKLGEGIGFFAEQIALAGPDATTFFGDLASFLAGQIATWGLLIKFLAKAYGGMHNFFAAIPGWVSTAGSFFAGLWDGIVAKGSAVIAWFAALPGRIGGFFAEIGSAVAARGGTIIAWFAALPGRIGAFISAVPGKARAVFVAMFDGITTAIGYGIGTIVRLMLTLPGKVYGAIVGLIARGRQVFSDLRAAAITNTTNMINTVVTFLRNLPPRAHAAMVAIVGRIQSVFSQARSAAVNAASSLVSAVVSFLHTLPQRAGNALSGFASAVAGRLRAAVGAAHGIGADIIRGVISGINSMIGAAVAAAKRAVGNIVSGAKSALGIGSPSKVMALQVGRWMLPGLVRGMEAGVPAARRAVAAAVGSVVPQVPAGAVTGVTGQQGAPGGGPNYYFAAGSIVLDVSKLKDIGDLMTLLGNLKISARAMHARTVTVGAR